MRKPALRLLPLCLAIACAARAEDGPEPTWELCPAPETLPLFQPLATGPRPAEDEEIATDIDAENLDVSKEQVTVLTGNVELRRGEQWLGTDKITYQHESETFVTEGDVKFQDRRFRFLAKKAEGNQKAETIRLEGVQYQFNDNLGNGRADAVTVLGDLGRMEGATYSTCPPDQRQWEIRAEQIDVDQASAMGTARNATLRLGNVPILWLPYLRFPTDDRRRSGVLSPNIGYDSEDGFKYEQPIYLNLAPNYDATLKPRLISERGLMLGGEFRYLFARHNGEIDATWMPNDRIEDQDRGLFRWRHFSSLSDHWYASADLAHVSDVEYFEDFGDSLSSTSVTLLTSRAGLYGRGLNWAASFQAQDWQIASPWVVPGDEPYREVPAARGAWLQPLAPWFEIGATGEAIRFRHDSLAGGDRIDVKPFVRLPFAGQAWFVTPEFAWRYTSYSLEDDLVPPGGDRTPDRSVPIMSLDAGAFFEREFEWNDGNYVQTLEPQLFYLHVPYRDQDDLPLFDTDALTFGWPSLFRTNRFGGGDRQADADQATLALTTRVLSADDGRELFSASLGRIHYFDPPRVTIPGAPALMDEGSAWVAESTIAVSRSWDVGLAYQWDPEGERTSLSAVRGQWRFGDGGLLNASYRYRDDLLEQTDLSFVLPVNKSWSVLGRWNYSLMDDSSLETLLGFEWRSCCVALRVMGREWVREFTGDKRTGIYVELELNGVGNLGRDTVRVLDDAILDYSQYSR